MRTGVRKTHTPASRSLAGHPPNCNAACSDTPQQLKQVGIDRTVEQLSWNEGTAQRQTGDYQLIIDSLNQGPAPDPYYLYSSFFGTTGTAKVGAKATTNWSRC